MYHSITFGDKNTWDDWHLVPSSRPLFNPPQQKVKTLDIPGGNGIIDLSQSLTGYPVFQNRTGSIEFYVLNDGDVNVSEKYHKPWQTAYSDIMDYLHGQTMRAVLEDDPEYFYEGRFTVNSWKSEKDWSKITIDYDVGPYKWAYESSVEKWKWDPFNFQNGIILPVFFENISVDASGSSLLFLNPPAYSHHKKYEKDEYCKYGNDIFQCVTEIGEPEEWNPERWVNIGEKYRYLHQIKIVDYSSDKQYAIGNRCYHSNKIYECISAIEEPEEWKSEHWNYVGKYKIVLDSNMLGRAVVCPKFNISLKQSADYSNVTEYSSGVQYYVGDLCEHSDKIYKCISQIDEPEEWNDKHWISIVLLPVLRIHFTNSHLGTDLTEELPIGIHQIPEFVFYGLKEVTIEMEAISEDVLVSIDFRRGRL